MFDAPTSLPTSSPTSTDCFLHNPLAFLVLIAIFEAVSVGVFLFFCRAFVKTYSCFESTHTLIDQDRHSVDSLASMKVFLGKKGGRNNATIPGNTIEDPLIDQDRDSVDSQTSVDVAVEDIQKIRNIFFYSFGVVFVFSCLLAAMISEYLKCHPYHKSSESDEVSGALSALRGTVFDTVNNHNGETVTGLFLRRRG